MTSIFDGNKRFIFIGQKKKGLLLFLIGIQRPLEVIYERSKSIYIPRGINVPALNRSTSWTFTPDNRVRVRIFN
jgi:vacuolar-type H+-ATPase catalytic subunit A/Vma1